MSTDPFDREAWERRWSQALREHGDAVAQRPPNAYLLDVVAALDPAGWRVVVAEERRRAQAGSGVDAVVHAVRVG